MKKTMLYAFLFTGLAFAACKKERTCECTTTYTTTETDPSGATQTYTDDPQTTKTVFKKNKKSDLETICGDSKSTGSSTGTSGNGSSYTSVSERKCKLN